MGPKHMNTEKPRLFIVNSFDRPDPRHVAEMRADGKLYYIHPELKDEKKFHGMSPDHATPLEDFGIKVEFIGNCLEGSKTEKSKAKYSNGTPREWQGQTKFSIPI